MAQMFVRGSKDGTVARALVFQQCVPGSFPEPGVVLVCGLSLSLVLYSAPRGFSLGTPVFPSPQKSTFSNSNSILGCTDISERVLELLGAPLINKLLYVTLRHFHLMDIVLKLST